MENTPGEMIVRALRMYRQTSRHRNLRVSPNKAHLADDNAPRDIRGDANELVGSGLEAPNPERALVGVYVHYTAFMAAFQGLEIIGKRNGLEQVLWGEKLHISIDDDATRYETLFKDLRLHDVLFLKEWLVAFGERAPSLRGSAAFVQQMLIELAKVDPSFRAVAGSNPNLARVAELPLTLYRLVRRNSPEPLVYGHHMPRIQRQASAMRARSCQVRPLRQCQ